MGCGAEVCVKALAAAVPGRGRASKRRPSRTRADTIDLLRESANYINKQSLVAFRASDGVGCRAYGAPTSAALIADITALSLYRILSGRDDSAAFAGTYHVAAGGQTTWYEYARYVLAEATRHGVALKVTPDRIQPIASEAFPTAAKRPRNSRLDVSKLKTTFDLHPPDWHAHVALLVGELTMRDTT